MNFNINIFNKFPFIFVYANLNLKKKKWDNYGNS